jgi:hypothetical protein
MRGSTAMIALLLALPSPPPQERAPTEARSLVEHLPAILPDISTWERSSGAADFDSPKRRFEYELYVDPARGASYAVTRYRIHVDDPDERRRADLTDTEKLQWDVDGRRLRRFECRPVAGGADCVWFEMAFDSTEYRRELQPILAVYAMHRNLLFEREQRRKGWD